MNLYALVQIVFKKICAPFVMLFCLLLYILLTAGALLRETLIVAFCLLVYIVLTAGGLLRKTLVLAFCLLVYALLTTFSFFPKRVWQTAMLFCIGYYVLAQHMNWIVPLWTFLSSFLIGLCLAGWLDRRMSE